MLNYLKKRVRNYGFWVSLSALIPLALQTFSDVSVLPPNYEEITSLLLSLIVALGICNNPTTKKSSFLDDKKDEDNR